MKNIFKKPSFFLAVKDLCICLLRILTFLVFNTYILMYDGNSFCHSEFGKKIKQSTIKVDFDATSAPHLRRVTLVLAVALQYSSTGATAAIWGRDHAQYSAPHLSVTLSCKLESANFAQGA